MATTNVPIQSHKIIFKISYLTFAKGLKKNCKFFSDNGLGSVFTKEWSFLAADTVCKQPHKLVTRRSATVCRYPKYSGCVKSLISKQFRPLLYDFDRKHFEEINLFWETLIQCAVISRLIKKNP